MIFEKGSKSNPTGNLILYCKVIGENPVQPGGGVIASNVVVSFLKLGENYPVVTFPPIALADVEALRNLLEVNWDAYDIIQLPDFEMPEDPNEANAYIQMQMERFNQVVMKYVELCKKKQSSFVASPVENSTGDGVRDYLEALANLSLEFRKATGLAKEATQLKVDRLMESFSSKHPQYDLHNFRRALNLPGSRGEELVRLYLKKFNAISTENYEDASRIKRQIQEIETSFSSSL